jgi:hypothetical protein
VGVKATDVAWAAGLFEGEGCITLVHKDKPYNYRLVLSMSDRDVVERFAGLFGGKVYKVQPPRFKPHWQTQWAWHATGIRMREVLVQLAPYFGERRRAKAHEAIEAFTAYEEEVTKLRACKACGTEFRPLFSGMASRVEFCTERCYMRTYMRGYRRKHAWA